VATGTATVFEATVTASERDDYATNVTVRVDVPTLRSVTEDGQVGDAVLVAEPFLPDDIDTGEVRSMPFLYLLKCLDRDAMLGVARGEEEDRLPVFEGVCEGGGNASSGLAQTGGRVRDQRSTIL
jgi:hypothetical protein